MNIKKNLEYEKLMLPFTLCIICILTFILTYNISLGEYTDFHVHTQRANDFLSGNRPTDYPMFYLTYGLIRSITGMNDLWATAYTQTFYALLCALAIYYISGLVLDNATIILKCAITIFMSFCGPIYIGGIHYYLGTGSFNTWHNPTNTCVKFLAIIIFYLFSYSYQLGINDSIHLYYKTLSFKQATLLLSLLCFISPLFKPSFFQVFAPTIAIIVLFDFAWQRIKFNKAFLVAISLIPACCLLLFQTYRLFFGGNEIYSSHSVIIAPFKVWNYWSVLPIPISIVLTVAFPIFVALFCRKGMNGDRTLYFAFVLYIMSIIEYSLLSETYDWESGNFGWGMNLAIGILFLSSVFQFIKYRRFNCEDESLKVSIITFCGYALISLHFIWGSWYYWKLLFSGDLGCF